MFSVVWQEEQVGLMDFVLYRHVEFRPWYVPWSRQIDLPEGLLLDQVLGLLLGHLGCSREIFDGRHSLLVSSGAVILINARKAIR